MSDQRDPLEERLRAALAAESDDVQPAPDGLSRIRGRISERRKHAWWTRLRDQWMTRPAFAAAASAGVIVLGLGATIGIGQASQQGLLPPLPGKSQSASSSTDDSTDPSSPEPSTSSKPGESGHTKSPEKTEKPRPVTVNVPVYHITKSGSDYGVTRSSTSVQVEEGTQREKQEQRAEGALGAIFDGGPQLRSTGAGVWQSSTSLEDADLKDGVLQVMLSSGAGSGNDSSPEAARAALKQLVFTGLDAAPSASSVQIRVGGAAVSSFWNVLGVNPNGVQRGDSAITRPFNTITSPEAGSTTVAGSVKVAGDGAYDGGQVHWKITENGQPVKDGTEQTGTGFASWSTTVDLMPGTYELTTFEQTSAGPGHEQSVTFTVFE